MNSYAASAVMGWLSSILIAIQLDNIYWLVILFIIFATGAIIFNLIEVVRSCKK